MRKLKRPKMILFDYGNTLIHEAGWNTLNGQTAVFKHVISNPNGVSAKDADDFALKVYESDLSQSRDECIEIHQRQFMQLMYETLGVKFDISQDEIERIFWFSTSHGAIMPKIDKLLSYINSIGIRSGVVSNIGFSGKLLKERIDSLLPHNKFEFIIASSEYVYRKPHKRIFELAIVKSGLSPDEIWFCGDHTICDVTGSYNAGMFPVRYDNRSAANLWAGPDNAKLDFDHLYIHDWDELIEILENAE